MALVVRPIRLLLAGSLAAGAVACAYGDFRPGDPLGREISLSDTHKAYTDAVRWLKFDEAARHLPRENRAAYLAQMPDPEVGRFTDWEAKGWEFDDPETRTRATIEVTYRAFSEATLIAFKVKERQAWSRADRANDWQLESEFTGLKQFGDR